MHARKLMIGVTLMAVAALASQPTWADSGRHARSAKMVGVTSYPPAGAKVHVTKGPNGPVVVRSKPTAKVEEEIAPDDEVALAMERPSKVTIAKGPNGFVVKRF